MKREVVPGMSSSPSTSKTSTCENICKTSLGYWACRRSIEASIHGLEDKALQKKLGRTLEDSLTCLSYLCKNRNICGQLYVPTWIVRVLRTSRTRTSEPPHLSMSVLSLMDKYPLTRTVILSSKGTISYTTPPIVGKVKGWHGMLIKIIDDTIKGYLIHSSFKGIKLEAKNVCLTLKLKGEEYIVCGRPDIAYFIYGFYGKTLVIVGDVALSPSVKHMVLGELAFHIFSYHLLYGTATVGLIVSPKSVGLIVPKLNMYKLLKKFFDELKEGSKEGREKEI